MQEQPGLRRQGNKCVPVAPHGAPCIRGDDCAGAYCVDESMWGWPGGVCATPGWDPEGCPPGLHLANLTNAFTIEQVCLPTCAADADCRQPHYRCYDRDSDGVSECAPLGTGQGNVGARCESTADCQGDAMAACLTDAAMFPSGYCTIYGCSEITPCPTGSHCALRYAPDGTGWCGVTCTTDQDCPRVDEGHWCRDYDGDGTMECGP